MSKSVIVTLFSTLILSISVNAWATPPLSVTYHDVSDDFAIVACGDYDVRTAALIRGKETLFFDKDDNPIRLRISWLISEAIYYNSLNPDIYIQQGKVGVGENMQLSINLVTGAERWTGANFRITLPGIGPLWVRAGHGTWDGENYAWNGAFILPEAGTGSALCEALAP